MHILFVMKGALLGVETGKFLVSCTRKEKEQLLVKLQDITSGQRFELLEEMPVPRRRRDENDKEVDVIFYRKKKSEDLDLENVKLAESTD